jgi:hypothetical protein
MLDPDLVAAASADRHRHDRLRLDRGVNCQRDMIAPIVIAIVITTCPRWSEVPLSRPLTEVQLSRRGVGLGRDGILSISGVCGRADIALATAARARLFFHPTSCSPTLRARSIFGWLCSVVTARPHHPPRELGPTFHLTAPGEKARRHRSVEALAARMRQRRRSGPPSSKRRRPDVA